MAAKLLEGSAEGRLRIDRYELVAEVASGGMATVFLARLGGVGGFQRFVALKRLHPHLAAEEEFVEMFLDEARLAAGIHHPNVVPILEVGASEHGYYIVMEYIEGDTLARLLARASTASSPLPTPIAVRIALDMLAGLHAAHELRDHMGNPTELVHRDVSPQNVLVGVDGIGRITDFGVARAASRLSATRVGQLKGKIAYMAPEQASANPSVDRRADVFSAGIVLWEVLAAKRLFKADNDAATLSRILSEPIPRLTNPGRGITAGLNAVLMKALERDPDKRFPTCAKFADALERAALAGSGVASTRELGAYVGQVFGQEIAAQREAVRAWLARSEPSGARHRSFTGPGSSVSAAAMAVPGSVRGYGGELTTGVMPGAAPRRRRRTGLVIALLLIALASIAAYVIVARPLPELTGPSVAGSMTAPPAATAAVPGMAESAERGGSPRGPSAAAAPATSATAAEPAAADAGAPAAPTAQAPTAPAAPAPRPATPSAPRRAPSREASQRGPQEAEPATTPDPARPRPTAPLDEVVNPYR